jgi:hypothetical protein
MKKRLYIKTAFISLLGTMLLSSCLKDNRKPDFADDAPVADFPVVAATGASLVTATISGAATTNTINAELTIGASHDYTSADAITVIIDQAAMTAASASYTLLPASTYTVASMTANVIPGIQQRIAPTEPIVGTPATLPTSLGAISFVVNTAAVKALPPATYVLPLTISRNRYG